MIRIKKRKDELKKMRNTGKMAEYGHFPPANGKVIPIRPKEDRQIDCKKHDPIIVHEKGVPRNFASYQRHTTCPNPTQRRSTPNRHTPPSNRI